MSPLLLRHLINSLLSYFIAHWINWYTVFCDNLFDLINLRPKILISFTFTAGGCHNYSLCHGSLRQFILAMTQPILDLYLWKFICMSIFYLQKKSPKKILKNLQISPNLAKFWNWLKTWKEHEKSFFFPAPLRKVIYFPQIKI